MALVLNDRVLETSTTQGTGSMTLNGPPSSYQSFNAGIGTGNTTYYAIFNTAADEWETGLGTLSGATTLQRTTVYQSSNADALVNFSVGTKNVFCTLPSQRSVYEDSNGNITGFPIVGGSINNTPIGATTANTGAFTNVTITSGQMIVPESTPSAASSGTYKFFSKNLGGRQMPSFVGLYGLDSALNPHFATNRVAYWEAIANTATSSSIGLTYTNTGTATAATYATTNVYTRFNKVENLVTTAATTAVAGIYVTANSCTTGAGSVLGGFHFIARFGPATGVATATSRLFCGLTNSVAAPTDVNPSTLVNMVGVGYDSADTNLQIMHNDGTGTATKIDLGSSFVVPTTDRTAYYQLALYSPPGSSDILYTVTNFVNSAVVSGTISSADVPAGTTTLSPRIYSSVGGTSSVIGVGITSIYLESDY